MSAEKSLSVRTGLLSTDSSSAAVVSNDRSTNEGSGKRLNSATKLTVRHGSKHSPVVEWWARRKIPGQVDSAWPLEVFGAELKAAQCRGFVKIIFIMSCAADLFIAGVDLQFLK